MKRSYIILAMIISAIFSFHCGQDSDLKLAEGRSRQEVNFTKPPEARSVSPLQLRERIDAEIRTILAAASDTSAKEAGVVVNETRSAIAYLLESNLNAASKSLETALGKAEALTASNPNLGMLPLNIEIRIHDLVADIETLKRIRNDVEDLTDEGYLQAARRLLEGLSSELTITNTTLPLATYPDLLKTAIRLTKERRPLDAAIALTTALSSLVIVERSVPLPLIRAERYLDAVDSLANTSNPDANEIGLLLDNADYEVRFAEALGYGKKDKEFGELYDAIKELKSEVKNHGKNSQKMVRDLRGKLSAFKTRISGPNA